MEQRPPSAGSLRRSAWRRFIRWTGVDIDPDDVPADERWPFVLVTVPAVLRSRYLIPARLWLLARTPAWIVARRLQRRTHGWYRVPSQGAADHVRLRFDVWPIFLGDHVRIQHGRLTAIGYSTDTFSEMIFVRGNGELEPDPDSEEMSRAWTAFWLGRQGSASK